MFNFPVVTIGWRLDIHFAIEVIHEVSDHWEFYVEGHKIQDVDSEDIPSDK